MRKLSLAFLLITVFVQCRRGKTDVAQESEAGISNQASINTVKATYDDFGIDVANFMVRDYKVKKNESLYLMLQNLDLGPQQIYRTIQKSKNKIDFRAFRPNQNYRAYFSKKDKKLKKLVWQQNAVDFVTLDWQQDSLQVLKGARAVTRQTKTIHGTIKSSLYNAISDQFSRDELVYKLTSILAWQVNFFNLRKGDTFRIVYRNKYVDGQFFDTGKVLAIELTNMGDTYFAYHFKQDDTDGYFDQDGNSVENALLKTPFKYDERISSRFNMHRMHPILHRRRPHTGVDFAAPYGTPVMSVGDGTVLEAHYGGAAGNIIKIRHNRTYKTAYMHLSKFAHGVHRGAHVKQGEVIGYVGNTGRVTGTHLHYSLYKKGRPVNPLKVKLPSSKSIPGQLMADFKTKRNRLNGMLLRKDSTGRDSSLIRTAVVQ